MKRHGSADMPDRAHSQAQSAAMGDDGQRALSNERAKRLRRELDASHASLREVSAQTGVPYRSLQNYLSGSTPIPLDVLARICTVYTISADYIIHGTYLLIEDRIRYAIRRKFLTPLELANAVMPGSIDMSAIAEIDGRQLDAMADSMTAGVVREYQDANLLRAPRFPNMPVNDKGAEEGAERNE